MNQLLLDLGPPPRPTFVNFVAGRNDEAFAALQRLCSAPVDDPPARCLYLWGEPGSGRSHLLRAACDAFGGRYLAGAAITPASLDEARAVDGRSTRWLLAIDDVETAAADAQVALFHLLNAMREDPRAAVVVAGNVAPRDLPYAPERDDLRSRLAWGLVYRLHALDDDAKADALARHATDCGFALTPDVQRYLLTHFARDLGSLMRTVQGLDRFALEQHRPITLPLIREFTQRAIQFPQTAAAGR